ncbi:helix-turn-helix domain-containing protein [Amycolatopsis rhizosphaerae]|uniref:Helix-turn-helix domain-containing protein n=1 Tax=Amycolatopsis rhizosphaerae TaxID=2053003 RepID=A0A558DLT0_9PSEU|nr:helix-turn-helix transcriptional regulator [Amycolatopsis rhizosphaerae]TVT61980.1 helix-turn-helix domain-containing protein [Amycolatopsis rhizosphaerae]
MADKDSGSTVPRRQLGRHLREARGRARLTVKAAAEALEWSEAKIWRIETGQTSLRSLDAEAMCRIYGVDAETTEALKGLAKETKTRGWWHAYGDVIPNGFDVYIGLEGAAASLHWYESELVPGLLQTPDYARAVISYDNPEDDPDEVELRVRLRMERQVLLTRPVAAPRLYVVLNEAILRRPVGGRPVMAGQLERLAQVSELPNVRLRVAGFAAGLHHGVMSGPFVLLRFPTNGDGKETEPPTVYMDGFTGALYLDKANEVARYDDAFHRIWDAALDEAASKDLFIEAAREFGS